MDRAVFSANDHEANLGMRVSEVLDSFERVVIAVGHLTQISGVTRLDGLRAFAPDNTLQQAADELRFSGVM